jgi:hypothetical protein
MSVNSDFRDLLFELNAADARFLVVGGYAIAFHAEPRFTKVLDVCGRPLACLFFSSASRPMNHEDTSPNRPSVLDAHASSHSTP